MNLCVNARDAVKDIIHKKTAPERSEDRFFYYN